MKKIELYQFGQMRVEGKIHANDLIILPGKIIDNWRREKGHLLQLKDIEIVEKNITNYRYLIVGCGFNNRMKIHKEIFDWIQKNDIIFFYGNSNDIVKVYNETIERSKNLVALFHLTC